MQRTDFLRAAVALAGMLVALEAQAATLCVSPAGGACQTTIQAAVNLAAPMDRITVAAGVYFENVTVPAGKDGLQIIGAGRTLAILDASPNANLGIAHTGDGLVIQSRNVQVKGLQFRNGKGAGISVESANSLIQGNAFYGQDQAGIFIVSNSAAYGTQILANEFRGVVAALLGGGPGTIVKTNVVADFAIGLFVGGTGAQVVGNRLSNGDVAIGVQGGDAVVASNDIRNATQIGITIVGNSPTVQYNRLVQSGSAGGIAVDCSPGCVGGSIAYNTLTEVGLMGYGVIASTDQAGLRVNNNTLLRAGSVGGLLLVGDGSSAVLNTVTDSGQLHNAPCLSVMGDFNYASRNLLHGCPGAGLYVHGDGNYLDRNTASGNFENGFTIDGYVDGVQVHEDNALYGNKATGNGGQGVAIISGAANTFVLANTGQKNRTDLCDAGSLANPSFYAANTFGTVSPTCPIVH